LAQLAEWGAARIELYTGPYARAKSDGKDLLTSYLAAADLAHSAGLGVNAGHDLALDNLAEFAKAIPDLAELSIGHAWTADCLVMGVKAATRAYLNKLSP
ncbi:MAG: pyridoxine 5'-phosphate synthase, partial [Pseudomonadota bacterium]